MRYLQRFTFSGSNLRYLDTLRQILAFNKNYNKTILNIKDKDENTPLELAISGGNPGVVGILMEYGAEIKKDKQKTNALHHCSR